MGHKETLTPANMKDKLTKTMRNRELKYTKGRAA